MPRDVRRFFSGAQNLVQTAGGNRKTLKAKLRSGNRGQADFFVCRLNSIIFPRSGAGIHLQFFR